MRPRAAFFVLQTADGWKIIDLSLPASILLFWIHDLVMLTAATVDLARSLIMASQVLGWQFEILYKSFAWGMVGVKL